MALKRDGSATGDPRASFRMEVIALDCSPILLVNDITSSAEGGVHDGLLKSSISTYLSLGISLAMNMAGDAWKSKIVMLRQLLASWSERQVT